MIDWLLIGGSSHGIVVRRNAIRRMVSFGSLYMAEDYERDGKTYRVGACHPTDAQRAELDTMIDRLKPRRLDHD